MNKLKIARFTAKVLRLINIKWYYNYLLTIFSTPPKVKHRPSDLATLFDVSTEQLKGYSHKVNFTLYKKLTSGTVILFAHGWGGSIQNFKYLIRPALERNISLIGFDAPAHGASTGKQTHIIEFKEVIKYCLDQLNDYEKVIVIGHSLGAAAAILAVMESPKVKVDHLFAVAAPADLKRIFDDYVTTMNISVQDATNIATYVKEKINLDFDSENWRNKPLPKHLKQITFIHGKEDDVIPIEDIVDLAENWKLDAMNTVRILEAPGHYNILKSPEAIKIMLSHLN
ncbi:MULTISPECIES: alpha/beta hydrolase [Sphingobacterium]|uniref:Alpha/beta hydrolase n=1 Tax=Sphingobacterium populi TaxID=1812824 RepID=A0ABW5U9P3_9SPHI|nr:alpha/beta hydrolase [Sphingobacterium sp. CFCC 11742]